MDWNVLKILSRQQKNAWSNLTLTARVEIAVLLSLIYLYVGNRLFNNLNHLRLSDILLYRQIVWGSALAIAFFFIVSLPVLLRRVLPAQNGFTQLLTLPMSPSQVRAFVFYYTHKYWIIAWAIVLPLPAALLLRDPFFALQWIAFTFFADWAVLHVFFNLFFRIHSSARLYSVAAVATIIWMAECVFLWNFPVAWPIFGIFLLLCLLGLSRFSKSAARPSMEPWLPLVRQVLRFPRPHRSMNFAGRPAKALFLHDWLNHLRNPSYLKSKGVLLLLQIFIGVFAFRSYGAEKAMLVFSVFWLVLIWWHYSGVFNRRFTQSEPEWFFRLTPLPFVRFFLMRFVNEFIFVLIMLTVYSIVLQAAGFALGEQWQWLLLLSFLSAVILLTMITFRILFYDDPGTGGFAYHFSVIFFTVMTLNYYFVGPLLTLFFMFVYLYKSYRFLKE